MTQEHLHEAWLKDFPGHTQAITSLRQQLVRADTDRLQTQSQLDHFRQAFSETDLPLYLWETHLQKKLSWLQKQHANASRDFHRALKALQSAMPQPPTKTAKPEPPPPPPPQPLAKRRFFQTATVTTTIDGKSITKVEPTAAYFREKKLWTLTDFVARQLHFVNGIIPKSYSYVLMHDGLTTRPAERFTITYDAEEFERLCELELETNSDHLLDGARYDYYCHPDLKESP